MSTMIENPISVITQAACCIRESLQTIIHYAPDQQLVNALKDTGSNPFLQSLLRDSNKNVFEALDNPDFELAVKLKELHTDGHLSFVDFSSHDGKSSKMQTPKNTENVQQLPQVHHMDSKSYFTPPTTSTTSTDIGSQEPPKLSSPSSEESLIDSRESNAIKIFDEINQGSHKALGVKMVRNPNYINDDQTRTIGAMYQRERADLTSSNELPPLPEIHDANLEQRVFTHESFVSPMNLDSDSKMLKHNERLEFIGDSFLNFVVSTLIYESFPYYSEGQLSQLRSELVKNKTLLIWAKMYGFDKRLVKNFSDLTALATDGKVYSDTFEAYLGAIYEYYLKETPDGITDTDKYMRGWFIARQWIERLSVGIIDVAKTRLKTTKPLNKSAKQELNSILDPRYIPLEYPRIFADDVFVCCLRIQKKILGYGKGGSIKECETRAAMDAISNPKLKAFFAPEFKEKMDTLESPILAKLEHELHEIIGNANEVNVELADEEFDEVITKHELIEDKYLIALKEVVEQKNSAYNKECISSGVKTLPKPHYGRGGIPNESIPLPKTEGKTGKGGIYFNMSIILESDIVLTTHQVMISCRELNGDARNQIYALYSKRGSAPDYDIYRTKDGKYLSALRFRDQIVSYGLDKNKKIAQQMAAMLALKREDYFVELDAARNQEDASVGGDDNTGKGSLEGFTNGNSVAAEATTVSEYEDASMEMSSEDTK